MKTIIYLYGYHSSPESKRAIAVKTMCESYGFKYICPTLVEDPLENIKLIETIVKENLNNELFLIGMSLGGRYVCYLAEKYFYAFTPILVSPAIAPLRTDVDNPELQLYVNNFFDSLMSIEVDKFLDPSKYYAFYSENDDILNGDILKDRLADTNYICYNTDHTLENYWNEIKKIIEEIIVDEVYNKNKLNG